MTSEQAIFITVFSVAPVALALGMLLGAYSERRSRAKATSDANKAYPAKRQPISWLSNVQPRAGTAGFTIASALNGVGCLGRSAVDEPVFVLCARDRTASAAVRGWAALAAQLGAKPEKVWDARELADAMDQWRELHGGGKIPD